MKVADLHAVVTPALKDKHFWLTAFFAAVVLSNHRLGLNLSVEELLVLGGSIGVFVSQSQLGAVAKIKALMAGSPPDESSAPPNGSAQ